MALVFTMPSGTVGAIVPIDTAAGAVHSPVLELGGGSVDGPETYHFEDDFDFIGAADPSAIPTAGVNVITGVGAWFARAIGTAGLLSAQQGSGTNHPGSATIQTSATINTSAYLQRGFGVAAAGAYIDPLQVEQVTAIVRTDSNTLVRVQVGLTSTPASLAPAAAAMFVFDTALSLNWLCVCRQGGLQTLVDSLVPVALATFYRLELRQVVAGTWTFHVGVAGGTVLQVGSPITINAPSSPVGPHLLVSNLVAAAKLLLVDYFGLSTKRLTR